MGKLKNMFTATDMTIGTPWKQIVLFAVPMLVGNIAQQMYNTVDSIVVGRYVGDNALAAVGSASPIVNLMLVLFIGISAGAGIMVSQYFGAKAREDLSKTIGNCITVSAIAAIIMMIIGPMVTRPLLSLLNTPESIFEWCASYLNIMLYGIAGMIYYNILSGILRGLGDSLSALLYLLVATVLNIVLDVYFVAQLGMGVSGVALATVIAQAVSAVLCFIKLLRMNAIFDLKRQHFALHKKYVGIIIKLGLPSGITQAIFSVAMIVVQSLTNSFGEMLIAANVIIMRVDGFAMMPNFTFGTATTTFTGQNIGAGRLDRVEKGTKDGLKLGLSVSVVLVALILFFGRYLMEMFTSTPDVIDTGMHMMRILSIGYIAMAVTQILSGVMRGAGDTMTPMWISLITTIVIRVPIAYGLAALMHSADALFISLLISWVMGAVLTSIAFRMGRWKKKSIINDDVPEPADV